MRRIIAVASVAVALIGASNASANPSVQATQDFVAGYSVQYSPSVQSTQDFVAGYRGE